MLSPRRRAAGDEDQGETVSVQESAGRESESVGASLLSECNAVI